MQKKPLQVIDFDKFSERMNSESDRACAVLSAALLDAKLETLFQRHLRSFHEELLGASRPIGSFSTRIQLANALALVSDDARADLDTIRFIRNKFAHSFDYELGFDDQSITDRCTNPRTAKAYIDGFDLAAAAPRRKLSAMAIHAIRDRFRAPRWRYQLSVEFLAQYLDEIATGTPNDAGSDLLAEVRALSANTGLK
jgi:hypothetical protein